MQDDLEEQNGKVNFPSLYGNVIDTGWNISGQMANTRILTALGKSSIIIDPAAMKSIKVHCTPSLSLSLQDESSWFLVMTKPGFSSATMRLVYNLTTAWLAVNLHKNFNVIQRMMKYTLK